MQEAKKKCYGKWNLPAGHLEFNESLEQGAIREIKEETGCDVKLDGVCYIANRLLEDDLGMIIIFNARIVNEDNKDEILDVKWFDYDEIIDKADDELREASLKKAIMNQKNNFIASMDIVDVLGI